MKNYITYFFIIFLVVSQLSCKKKQQVINDTNTVEYSDSVNISDTQTLKIIGNQIWVREKPTTGDVIMKLDDGTKCKVLEKGKKQTIKGISDYWYKIEYQGKKGWVFGSQTSLRQKQTIAITSIKDAIESIKNNKFLQLIGDSIYVLENAEAGLNLKAYSIDEVKSMLPEIKKNSKIFYDKEPAFDGETYEENGIFVNDVKDSVIPNWIEVPENLKNVETQVKKVVEYIDNNTSYKFYLSKSGDTYKIIIIDIIHPGEA